MQIDLPSSYSQISLGQWHDFHNAQTDAARIMAITGLTLDVVRTIPMDQYTRIIEAFRDVASRPEAQFKPTIKIGATIYGFIPNLEKMSTGEYLDLVNWHEEKAGGFKANMLKIMACLYRPVVQSLGGRHQIKPYHEMTSADTDNARSDIREMPMSLVEGCMVFFWTLQNELLIGFHEYSQSQPQTKIQTTAPLL